MFGGGTSMVRYATYDYARQVETTLESINGSDGIHPDNQEAIREFKRDLSLEGKSDARMQKVLSHLKIIAEHAGDDSFAENTLGDIKDLVEWVHRRDPAETTQADYKKVIKQFSKCLEGENGDNPDKVDWITTTGPSSNGMLPKDLLTRDDVNALKEARNNPRDRAFIALFQ
jgi:site-specific recombinase XerD